LYKKLLLPLGCLFFSACSSSLVETPKVKNMNSGDKIVENIENTLLLEEKRIAKDFNSQTINRKISSIFKPKEQSIGVGQIITVNISESLRASSSDKKNLTKGGSISKTGGVVANATGVGAVSDFLTKNVTPFTSIGWESDKETSFSGNGTASRQDSFDTTITAFITKQINHNIFKIEGFKEINLDGQYQVIKISGFARKRQLKDYQIKSTDLANFKINFETKGDVAESSEQNTIGRIIDSALF